MMREREKGNIYIYILTPVKKKNFFKKKKQGLENVEEVEMRMCVCSFLK
jgi:hypothetical protein